MAPPNILTPQLVDEIHQLALERTKTVYQRFRQIQHLLQSRRKKTKVYAWTVTALQRQTQRQLCEDRLLSERHEAQYMILTHRCRQLEQEIAKYTQQIQVLDEPLGVARAYAQERHAKHQTRQGQYNRYRRIPFVGTTFKRKTQRALKKSIAADTELATQQSAIDRLKEKRSAKERQRTQERHALAQIVQDSQGIQTRIKTNERLEKQWMDGLAYWTNEMESQCLLVDQKTVALQHMLRTTASTDFIAVLNGFRSACLAYVQTESFGEHHYSLIVDFICAKCGRDITRNTPRPDKTCPTDLLCPACYQGSRTTMIIKKKLGLVTQPILYPPPYTLKA